MLPAAAADHRAYGLVRAKIVGAVDIQQRAELRAGAVDAALDGADRAAADRRGVFIGEAGGAYQDQRFTLVLRQFFQRRAKLLELQMRALRRLGFQRLGIAALGILDLAPPLAIVGAEQVAQDREQPRRQIRAGLERVDIGQRPQQRFLDEVVGSVGVAAERDGEGAQARHRGQNFVAKCVCEGHQSLPSSVESLVFPVGEPARPPSSGASSFRISSAKRSGTPCRTTSSYMARSWWPIRDWISALRPPCLPGVAFLLFGSFMTCSTLPRELSH